MFICVRHILALYCGWRTIAEWSTPYYLNWFVKLYTSNYYGIKNNPFSIHCMLWLFTMIDLNTRISMAPNTTHGMSSGLILGLRPANERRRYFVTASLIGWAQAQNQPWSCNNLVSGPIKDTHRYMCIGSDSRYQQISTIQFLGFLSLDKYTWNKMPWLFPIDYFHIT